MDDEHVEVEATWSIHQRIVAACRKPDKSKTMMQAVTDAVTRGVPAALVEICKLGHTPEQRAADMLAFFDRTGTSNRLTEAINGWLKSLRGTAIGLPQC